MNFGALVSVALILVLAKSSLKHDDAHGPNVAFVRVGVSFVHLFLQGLGDLRRQVDVGSRSVRNQDI